MVVSREVKRVALDFEWPLKKVWKGYVNPHFKRCEAEDCRGGETAASAWVSGVARLIAMLGEEAAAAPHARELQARGRIHPHPYLEAWAQAPRDREPQALRDALAKVEGDDAREREVYRDYWRRNMPKLLPLTEELASFVSGVAGRKINAGPFNQNPEVDIYRALLRAAKITDERWGSCRACGGSGIAPEAQKTYDAWEPEEPPAGPGWQLWETVTEGSPISPVFERREGLVSYLEQQGYSRKAAEEFTRVGFAPSGAMVGGKMYDGIEFCGIDSEERKEGHHGE